MAQNYSCKSFNEQSFIMLLFHFQRQCLSLCLSVSVKDSDTGKVQFHVSCHKNFIFKIKNKREDWHIIKNFIYISATKQQNTSIIVIC